MSYVCINGDFVDTKQAVFPVSNRAFQLGDGLFETIKVEAGRIQLAPLHWERLQNGLEKLKISFRKDLTLKALEKLILSLCEKNKCSALGRVRLTVFRDGVSLTDNAQAASFVIETKALDKKQDGFNEEGLAIDFYTEYQKSCDAFSNLKSINRLPLVMADLFAKENQLDDCLLLNSKGNVAESTIANVFLIRHNQILTPALTEGCVEGVMRKRVIEVLEKNGKTVWEGEITINDMLTADEMFLTNAIRGIKWVKSCSSKSYDNKEIRALLKFFDQDLC